MSVAYFIVLDNDDPGFDPFVNGKRLATDAPNLDAICATLGLPSFADFVSMDLGDIFAEDELEPSALVPQWFTAEEGLSFVTSLRQYVIKNPSIVKNATRVVEDLDEYVTVFTSAKAIGAKWHLEVDY